MQLGMQPPVYGHGTFVNNTALQSMPEESQQPCTISVEQVFEERDGEFEYIDPKSLSEVYEGLNVNNPFADDFVDIREDDENAEGDAEEIDPHVHEEASVIATFISQYKNDTYDRESDRSQLLVNAISHKLTKILGSWMVIEGVQHSKMRVLLGQLRDGTPLILPRDPRTIAKTPRKTTPAHRIGGGEYLHLGLAACIPKIISARNELDIKSPNLRLSINIDGAPIGKSSTKSIWPILCSEKEIKNVFIVGVYCGSRKPDDPNEYLRMFVDDATELANNGYELDGQKYTIDIDALICDAPAKAFKILNVKGHSGYASCTKCTIEGEWGKNGVCFPDIVSKLRTDEDFLNNKYLHGYQRGETILSRIPRCGLVTNVPLDIMHLGYVGVDRKLLFISLFGKGTVMKYRLSGAACNAISQRLISYQSYVPYEFARKPLPLEHIKLYKATHHRQFCLYIGAVALQDQVDPSVYKNFLLFHVAVTVLNSPLLYKAPGYIKWARELLETFVIDYKGLYGPDYVTHNIHNLLHLTTDSEKHGLLEEFSAFKFENYIARIKRMLRNGLHTLQQIERRLRELEALDKPREMTPSHKLRLGVQCRGVVDDALGIHVKSHHQTLELSNFKINCTDGKNNYLLIDSEAIVKIDNIVKDQDDKIHLIGREVTKIGDLYDFPDKSSKLGIHVVGNDYGLPQKWSLDDITAKLFRLPYEKDGQKNYVVLPILHTFSQVHNTRD